MVSSDDNTRPTLNAHAMAGHLVRRLHQLSTQIFTTRMQAEGFDLTSVQFAALDAVRASPGIDQAGVAALIAYDRATIGGVIDRLVQKGLVSRTVSRRDRRARELSLTEKGTEMFDAVLPIVRDLQADILTGLDKDEARAFLESARKILSVRPDP